MISLEVAHPMIEIINCDEENVGAALCLDLERQNEGESDEATPQVRDSLPDQREHGKRLGLLAGEDQG